MPPTAASGRNTLSACPNAILPQGNPPKGTLARTASSSVQTAAAQTGHQASRDTAAIPMQPTATNSASATASASHGTGPTSSPVQCSSGSMKPSPASRPRPKPARSRRPCRVQPSSAKPGRTSHHRGRGGKLRYSITPESTAAAGRTSPGRSRLPPAVGVDCGSSTGVMVALTRRSLRWSAVCGAVPCRCRNPPCRIVPALFLHKVAPLPIPCAPVPRRPAAIGRRGRDGQVRGSGKWLHRQAGTRLGNAATRPTEPER